ncbi:hypothetical protein BC941DRAFT_443989 [Chlamydoabsidia padenii]|nr:hypothetical protein BC941DRAFT_443989 [Chlamydoabsidia padenii]
MLNGNINDYEYPLINPREQSDDQTFTLDQSIQKWMNMVNRCLEQQWKDSQDLLGHTKALTSTGHHQTNTIKKLNSLGFAMMQRSIHLRQELVDNAYLTNASAYSSYADNSNPDGQLSSRQTISPLSFSSFSTPQQSTKQDDIKRQSTNSYSPFTLHSKLWKQRQDRQQQSLLSSSSSSSLSSCSTSTPRPLISTENNQTSSSSPLGLAICGLSLPTSTPSDEPHQRVCESIPSCAYSYYPPSSNLSIASAPTPIQPCCFCQATPKVTSTDHSEESPFTTAAIHRHGGRLTSSSSPLLRKIIKSPSILIPTSDSSLTKTTPPPFGDSLASHITPSTPSSSSSIVHTMSTKFHFKRSDSGDRSSSLVHDNASSTRFVRSLIGRKVSLPSLFTSKKVHPMSSNNDTHSAESSYFS